MPPGEPFTLREIAERLDHPVDSRLRAAIRSLRAAGTITMTGTRRTARYVRRRRSGR
jgi:DNA-binding GntR family transcriptional regulator